MQHSDNDMLHDIHNYGCYVRTREIFLHNHHAYDDNPGIEYKMSNIFIKNLRALESENFGDITIHMQSIGGEWADGMAIYDSIKMAHSKITIVSYGQTESMSTIILQAAARRLLTPRSYFMVHYGGGSYSGSYQDNQNWAIFEKKLCDQLIDIYADKCQKGKFFKDKGYDINKVKKFLHKKFKDGDWYLTSDEAVLYGFADKVISKW